MSDSTKPKRPHYNSHLPPVKVKTKESEQEMPQKDRGGKEFEDLKLLLFSRTSKIPLNLAQLIVINIDTDILKKLDNREQ